MSHWLLLRGLSREQRHWGVFPDVLKRTIPDATVHLLDLPGTGTENRRLSPNHMRGIMEDVRARWLRNPASSKRCHLVGISLGGMVAQEWVHVHPEEFVDVALVNTSASNLSRPWERMVTNAWVDVMRSFFADHRAREEAVLRLTTRLQKDHAELVDRWVRIALDRPMTPRNAAAQLAAASTWRAPQSLPVPTLVVTSERDGLVSAECSRKLAARYRAEQRVHPEAGHDLPSDDPVWLANQLAHWSVYNSAR